MTNVIESLAVPGATSGVPAARMVQQHLRWPTERFYWAVLDGSSLPRNHSGRRRREQLGYLFENVLPGVSIEDIQTAYVAMDEDGQHVIACGVPTTMIREAVDGSSFSDILTLSPAEIPQFVKSRERADVDPEQFNLLTGDLEPNAVRQSRRRMFGWAVAMLVLISGALTIGLQRRIAQSHEQLTAVQQQEGEIHRHVLGSIPAASSQPPHLRLLSELRQLQQTRQPSGGTLSPSIDIVRDFETLMSAWPESGSVFMQTESIVITDQSIAIRGRVPTMADVQVLADALTSDGWKLQQPQSNQVTDRSTKSSVVELSLWLDRASSAVIDSPGLAEAGGS